MNGLGIGLSQILAHLHQVRAHLRHRARLHRALRPGRWWHYGLLTVLLLLVLPMATAALSFADDTSQGGQVWTGWLAVKDSHGIPVSHYGLRVSQGGITDPITALGAFLLQQFWSLYCMLVMVTAWCLDFVLQFKFLGMIRGPAGVIAGVITQVVGQVGLIGAAVTVSALISTVWILKGRTGAGFGEIAVSFVIAALIGTVISNPVQWVTGDNGAIVQAQRMGSGLTVDLLTQGHQAPGAAGTDPATHVQSVATARVLDTFIRTPHQLLNYGMQFDRPGVPAACQQAYDSAVNGHSQQGVLDHCPAVAKQTAEHPQNSLIGAVVIMPAAGFLLLFVFVLLLATAFLTGVAAVEAALFLMKMLQAIFPGSNRAGLFTALCTMLVACGLLVVAVTFVGVFILALGAVFDQTRGMPVVQIYLVIDILELAMIIGLITTVFRARKHGKKAGSAAARALSPRPVALPQGRTTGSTALAGARTAASMVTQRRMSGRLAAAATGGVTGAAAGGATAAAALRGHHPPAPQPRSKLATAARVTGKVAKASVAYTVGAPVAVPRAAAAAQTALTARKTAMAGKLSATKSTVRTAAQQRIDGAKDYAREYRHNVGAAARFVGNGLVAGGAMMAGVPNPKMTNRFPDTPSGKSLALPTTKPGTPNTIADLNRLRANLGQAQLRRPVPKEPIVTFPTPPAQRPTQATQASLDRLRERLHNERLRQPASTRPTPALRAGGGRLLGERPAPAGRGRR